MSKCVVCFNEECSCKFRNQEKTNERVIQPDETNKFVTELHDKINGILANEINQLHPKQRFLIHARVVNLLFSQLYDPMIMQAERVAGVVEKSLKDEV